MAEDLEATEGKPCCDKPKCVKLRSKYQKLEERKNQFRDATNLIQEKYNAVEQQNASLKQALGDLEVEVRRWQDEKEKETGIRVDLEDEVSALKEEIELLKQNGQSGSGGVDEKHQECLESLEKEMNRMKELFEKEKGRADSEKKKAEMQRKKADDALKKLEKEKKKVSEAQGVANTEMETAEKNRLLLEKLKNENDALKSEMALKGSKSEAADKKLEAEKQETNKARKLAEMNMKKAEENKRLWEKGKVELDAVKLMLSSERLKFEAAEKKVEAEKQETIKARKQAEMNMKKAEEFKLHLEKMKLELNGVKSMLTSERSKSAAAEKKVEVEKQNTSREKNRAEDFKLHLEKMKLELDGVKSMLTSERLKSAAAEKKVEVEKQNTSREKARADDLTKKLEQESTRVRKLEEELCVHRCPIKLVDAHAVAPSDPKSICAGAENNDTLRSQGIRNLLEKDQTMTKEKRRVDSERKKAKKLRKAAKEHKMMALQEKYRADRLSKELEVYKLRLKELGKGPHEFLQYKTFADSCRRCNDNIYETETVKLLKNQLKLEEMLTKHAKEATKLEVLRNNILHQELLHLKKECCRFQQRLDMLDGCFLSDSEGIHELEKVGNQTFEGDKFYSDELLASGIDSRLNHPCRGSKRNILQSSAINSSSASIEDQSLVGSPRSSTFRVLTSAKLGAVSNADATILKLPGKKRMRDSENDVTTAKNTKSQIRGNDNENADIHSDLGIISDALVPVENLNLKGRKSHQPVLGRLTQVPDLINDHTSEIIQENACEKHVRPFKRRKNYCDGAIVINPSHEPGNLVLHANISDSDASIHAASPVIDAIELDQSLEGRMDDILGSNPCIPMRRADLTIDYYMKLLDLDNEADEKSYCQAIALPLSPTLPDIEFHEDEVNEVDTPEIMVDKRSQNGVCSIKDSLGPISSCDAYDSEKEPSTNLVLSNLASRNDDSVKLPENTDIFQASHAQVHQTEVSGETLSSADVSSSGNEEMKMLYEKRMTSTHGRLLKYYIISSDNRDSHSILRILQAISSCMPQCCLLDSPELFLQNLITNLNAEDVSMKERVCVFFSIILHAVSGIEAGSLINACSDDFITSLTSITLPIRSALSGLALRGLFVKSCDLAELLALAEDFIEQRKVFACADSSAEMQVLCSAKLNLDFNGNGISLYEEAASSHQLVVSGCLFASICSGIDHIGLVCEISCNIFSMENFDPAIALAIFHAFAHTCGSKYFNLHDYALSISVIKSLVMFLEKRALSTNSMSQTTIQSRIWSCSTSCPFSEGTLPVESVASLLVNKLQVHGRSVLWTQDSRETMNSLFPGISSIEECTGGSATREAVPLSTLSTSAENMFSFMNILSLVEILASFMGWDWTKVNFMGQFRVFFESHIMEDSSAAIFILLGQLGRLGVAARGYEDTGVKELRKWLSALLHQSVFSKLNLVTQSSVMTAVLGLTPLNFEDILQSKDETLLALSTSFDAKLIQKWFSLLSKEQQSFFRLQLTEK